MISEYGLMKLRAANHNLAIVILVYNSSNDAILCLDRLLSFKCDFKVIVVDNCSTDDSYCTLKHRYDNNESVDIVRTQSNCGYSSGNNYGIRYASDKYNIDSVAIMNPDVIIPNSSVLENLVELLWRYEDCLAVGGQPYNHLNEDKKWPAGWKLPNFVQVVSRFSLLSSGEDMTLGPEIEPNVFKTDCIVGCFFIAKLSAFMEIGLFDESVFLYNEENILGKKCKQAGLSLLIDNSQLYQHNHAFRQSNTKSLPSKLIGESFSYKSRRYLVSKYYSPILILPLAFIGLANYLIIIAGHIKHSELFNRAKRNQV